MRKNILIPLLCFIAVLVSNNGFSQEISPERKTEYTFKLNKIKHQQQVDDVTVATKKINNVTLCKLDWLNYKMTVVVNEGGANGALSMEKIKEILIRSNVALVNFSKKGIK
jgi:hypothetical protein